MPGMEGLAMAPMMASVARVALSSTDSNQWSSRGRAAPASTSIASGAPGPRRAKERPRARSCRSPRRPGRSRFGGAMVKVGSMKAATRSSIASYSG